MRRTAVLSGLVLVGGLLGPSTAFATESAPDTDPDRWIAVQDHFAIVLPDGETFTEENAPPQEEQAPPVGTRVFISEALHATDDGTTPGDEIGRTHIECTAQIVEFTFLCDIAFVLDTGSQLHGSVHVDFSAAPESEPLHFDIAVTGGTGDLFGATGAVTLTDITEDPQAEVMTLYEPDLVLPYE